MHMLAICTAMLPIIPGVLVSCVVGAMSFSFCCVYAKAAAPHLQGAGKVAVQQAAGVTLAGGDCAR